MKHVLVSFTVCMYSLFLFGSEAYNSVQAPNTFGVLDSLDIFNTITDVEKQMQKIVESQEENVQPQIEIDLQEVVDFLDTIERRVDVSRPEIAKAKNQLSGFFIRAKKGRDVGASGQFI